MFRCILIRQALARCLDQSSAVPPKIELHLNACPDCAAFLRDQSRLIAQLKAGARTVQHDEPPFLHARIMAALPRQSAPVRRSWRPLAASGVFVGTALLAAIAYWKTMPSSEQPSAPPTAQQEPFPTPLAFPLPKPDLAKVSQWTTQLDDPLEKEMRLLLADAKSAAHLLAQNFLPSSLQPDFKTTKQSAE